MTNLVLAIIALGKIVPAILEILDAAASFYTQTRIAEMKKEFQDGIRNAVKAQDQRDLEHAIGSPTAGQPSGIAGTEIRDTLPGVNP